MAFIKTVDESEAGDLYEADRKRQGYVSNFTRVFAHRPRVFAAWQELNAAIKASMDLRRYELATIAAARELRSSYCMLAHGRVLANEFYDAEEVRAIAAERPDANIDEVDIAVMELARRVARDASTVTESDAQRLRDLGLDDGEIMDVVLAAAARCFFSKALDALGIEPDSEFWELDPALREELTVGRPIAARSVTDSA